MNKYIITTAVALSAITGVFAEEGGARRMGVTSTKPAVVRPATGTPMMMPPTITTGDTATDAQIKVLQAEMEAKIKAIREEYQAKIKAVIGDKKVRTGKGEWEHGTSTMRGDGRRGTTTMMNYGNKKELDRMMYATGSSDGRPKMMRKDEEEVPAGSQVKGVSTSDFSGESPSPLKGFFNRFFGR